MIPFSEILIFLEKYTNPNSFRAYKRALTDFKFHYLAISDEKIFQEHLIQKTINNLMKDLHASKKAKSTISRTIYILNCFFKHCIEKGYIDRNPMTNYDRICLTYADFKVATLPNDFDFEAFINAPDQYTFKGNNERMILFLISVFGLKRSEILKLKLGDLIMDDEDKKMIIHHSKKYRTRIYKLKENAVTEFKDFLERRELYSKYKLDESDFLFQSSRSEKNSKPIDGSTIYRIVERHIPRNEEASKINPSSFRLHKVLVNIHTRKYYELGNHFGISHKEISKYKVLDARERLLKESKELIESLVKLRVEAELERLTKSG